MIFLFVITAVSAALAYTYMGQNLISSREAKRLIKEGKIKKVVDVRTNAEWRAGHYPGAVHIPATMINRKTTAQLPKKGLLVYCNTGQRARFAAEKLRELGFKDVYYIAGTHSSLH